MMGWGVDCVSCCRTPWTTEVSCGQGAVWCLGLLRARCGAHMMSSRRRQRRRTSDERLGDGRPGRRAAKVERSPQDHQIEVRRRNGRCKPARTCADRTLVLTETGRGNSDGFVAFTGFFLRLARTIRAANDGSRSNACGMRGTPWRTTLSCGGSVLTSCVTARACITMRARRLQVDCEQREARRQGSHHGRRQPHGDDTAETTFVALLADRSARTSADRFSRITKPPGSRQAASSRHPKRSRPLSTKMRIARRANSLS